MSEKNQVAVTTVKELLQKNNIKARFNEILGKKSAGFISSVINVSNLPQLKDCESQSVLNSAVVAATLDLPIDPNLGFAYIVPYNDKNQGKIAQFQMGYKGFIQLAMRTGQYKTINAGAIYEGEISRVNRLTGEVELTDNGNINYENIVGYFGYFKLLNGFEKMLYMTKEEIEAHAKKYSQSYKSNKEWVVKNSLWSTDFDTMAQKTVLKRLLSKYGILSIEMQKALSTDQSVVDENGNATYVDNRTPEREVEEKANTQDFVVENVVDVEYKEDEILGQTKFEQGPDF